MKPLSEVYENIRSVKKEMDLILKQNQMYSFEDLTELLQRLQDGVNTKSLIMDTEWTLYTLLERARSPEEIRCQLVKTCIMRFDSQDPYNVIVPTLVYVFDCMYCPIEKVPEYISEFPVVSAWRLAHV